MSNVANLCLTLAALLPTGGGPPEHDLLIAIADMYDDNRSRFAFAAAKFDYLDARSRDLSSARAGDFSQVDRADGEYVFRGDDAFYTRLFTAEAMASRSGDVVNGRFSSTLGSVRILTNGKLTLREQINSLGSQARLVKGHRLAAGVEEFYRIAEFPLDLGRPDRLRDDAASNLREAAGGSGKIRLSTINEKCQYENATVVRVELGLANGNRTYLIDLEKGAIPIMQEDITNQGNKIIKIMDNIKLYDKYGWFPLRRITYYNNKARIIHVKELVLDRKPPSSAFQMRFDQPAPLLNLAEGRSYKARLVWDLDDLPTPASPDSLPLRSDSAAPSRFDPPEEAAPRRVPYLRISAAAALRAFRARISRKMASKK